MKRVPHNLKTDNLVNRRLIGMSYGQIGEAGGMRREGDGPPLPGHWSRLGWKVRERFS